MRIINFPRNSYNFKFIYYLLSFGPAASAGFTLCSNLTQKKQKLKTSLKFLVF